MTRAATSPELVKLRSNGQWARWKCIIDNPDTIYTARATGAVGAADWSIGYDGGSGTIGNCLADMTLLVGSTSGGWERGIARLRKAPDGSKFYIGADPSIVCQDNDYLTVLNDFAPFARHPVGTLMDVDVAYSDQFTDFVPVAVWDKQVAVISAGGTIAFDLSASWAPGSTISGYSFTMTGASSTSGTTTATPSGTYNTSGRFRVALTLTAANGKTSLSYAWVYVLGANLAPDSGVIIQDPEGETEIGWACQILAYDRPTIKDKARVVVYAEDYYSNELGSIGPVSGAENIIMVGWIVGETIIRAPGQDYVEFTVGGPGVFCGSISTLPAGLTDKALPTDTGTKLPAWSKMNSLSIVKGLHYLIHYRSTLAKCISVEVEDLSYPAGKLTADDDTLWGQLVTLARQGVLTCTPNRYGHLYIQRDAALIALASRSAIPVVMTLTDADWSDELSIVRRQVGAAGMAEAEGSLFAGGKLTPTGGRSPGDVPGPNGTVENISEVCWPSAAAALEIAGLMAGRLNAEYESIGVYHPSNNHFIDVAPRQYVDVTVDGATLRTIPRRVSLHREDSGQVHAELELEPEGGQWPAVPIEYPGEGGGTPEPPPEPPPPPPPPVEPPEPPPEASGADAVVVTGDDVRVCADLDQASPTWTSIKGSIAQPIHSDMSEVSYRLVVIEAGTVWICDDVTAASPAWTPAWYGDSLTGGTLNALMRVRFAPGSEDIIYVLGYGMVDETPKPFLLCSSNGGVTWTVKWINEELTVDDFTMDVEPFAISKPVGQWWEYATTPVVYKDEAKTAPLAFGYQDLSSSTDQGCAFQTDAGSLNNFNTSADEPITGIAHMYTPNILVVSDYLDSYFGVDGYTWQTKTPRADAEYQRFGFLAPFAESHSCSALAFLVWDEPYINAPRALDVARTNPNYVYVGLSSKIIYSTNGGTSWNDCASDRGATDIRVDPQLAGVIYAVDSHNDVVLIVANVVQPELDTTFNNPENQVLARSIAPDMGKLWALKGSNALRMRYLGTWSDLKTGMLGGRGMDAYPSGKLFYLDSSDIYYSDDYGVTQTAKKGGWSDYAGGINAHLLKVTT